MSAAVESERRAPAFTASAFGGPRVASAVRRETLPGCEPGPLYFAQVREDPALEIAALTPTRRDTIVCVSSGGCTALSLLAAGAGRVTAVDLNPTQNHVVELKAAAVGRLSAAAATAFLGGRPAWEDRLTIYRALRGELSPKARAWWDERPRLVRRGAIRAGVSERFIGAVVLAMRALVHPKSRVDRLLGCRTLDEQRELYAREWDTWRWRALYALLLDRRVFHRAYDPRFFAHVDNPSFAAHFLRLAEHALTTLPVADNYFLHQMLTGHYPASEAARPPYLSETGAPVVAGALDRLTLVDGDYAEWLRRLPTRSVDGFALSNICEWLTPDGIDALFREIVRTAAPGARLCFRNFVGWTELPAWCAAHFTEERESSAALSARDRSMVQPRIVVCRLRSGGGGEVRA